MNEPYKPEAYNSISPYLIVQGAQKVIDFLTKTFDAKVVRRYDMPDGSIVHCELRIDDSIIMMGDAGDNYPAIQSHIHVYVADVDAVYTKSLEAGGISIQKPERKEGDPDRRGSVKDPCGNTWSFATQM